VADTRAVAWISEWNALTPHPHWQLIPGEYRANQEVLVLHWHLIYRLYGCVPDFGYENEAAGLHMHLLEGAHTHRVVVGNQKLKVLQRVQQLLTTNRDR